MRRCLIIILFVGGFLSIFAQEQDPVDAAMAVNQTLVERKNVDPEVAKFLVTAADARMMDMSEGKLATQRGTTKEIKEYGKVMLNDQKMMLSEIKKMAKHRKIALPSGISNEKEEGRKELAELKGKEFDKKFVRMMIIDHKRDLRLFRKAVKSNDDEISEFAELYIPVLQSHLVRIKEIQEDLDS
jgi:putative membrane protein